MIDKTGRKSASSDENAGNWTYVRNAMGDVVAQGGPGGVCQTMRYDGSGRLVLRSDYQGQGNILSKTTATCSGTETHTSSWTYDTLKVGALTSERVDVHQSVAVETESGMDSHAKAYAYDSLARVSGVVTTYDDTGSRYSEQTTYDEFGRVFQSFFEVNNAVMADVGVQGQVSRTGEQTEYNAAGYPLRVFDAYTVGGDRRIYNEIVAMDARGQVTESFRFTSAKVTTKQTYAPRTGRLETIQTADGRLQDLVYDWDLMGNLKSRDDKRKPIGGTESIGTREVFEYDELQRLVSTTLTDAYGVTSNQPEVVQYDKADGFSGSGNISSRTGVGEYTYGSKASECSTSDATPGPAAVSMAGDRWYCYDARGNVVRDSQRELSYTAFDHVYRMTSTNGGATAADVEFNYGSGRERVQRRDWQGQALQERTQFVGAAEIHARNDGALEVKRYLGGVTLRLGRAANGNLSVSRDYLFADVLGSTHTVTDEFGQPPVGDRLQSFDPFGSRRNVLTGVQLDGDLLSSFDSASTTRHGFTGHEQVDGLDIIHMNGRIYDPYIGRFLQADPVVQSPGYGPSWNRYAYTFNNPLAAVDPSGYSSRWLRAAAALAITIWSGGAAAPNATYTFFGLSGAQAAVAGGFLAGVVQSGNLKGGLIGAFSAGMFVRIGDAGLGTLDGILAHGAAGGVTAVLQGGKFGHGFSSAAFSKAMSPVIENIEQVEGRIITASVIGGTASILAGGKFANGAVTGAFSRAFNEEFHQSRDIRSPELDEEGFLIGGFSPASGYYETREGAVVGLMAGGDGLFGENGDHYQYDYLSGKVDLLASGAIEGVYPETYIGAVGLYRAGVGLGYRLIAGMTARAAPTYRNFAIGSVLRTTWKALNFSPRYLTPSRLFVSPRYYWGRAGGNFSKAVKSLGNPNSAWDRALIPYSPLSAGLLLDD